MWNDRFMGSGSSLNFRNNSIKLHILFHLPFITYPFLFFSNWSENKKCPKASVFYQCYFSKSNRYLQSWAPALRQNNEINFKGRSVVQLYKTTMIWFAEILLSSSLTLDKFAVDRFNSNPKFSFINYQYWCFSYRT